MINESKRKIGRLTYTYINKTNFQHFDYFKNYNKLSKKTFFLKYMQSKGIIPDPKKKPESMTEIKKTEGLNLKELLDEKNIQINISDILKDYKYFKREYYTVDLNPPQEKPNLPFDRKDISFKKVFHYYFVQVT
jgi:hypothetical protein